MYEMRILIRISGITEMVKVRNYHITGSLRVPPLDAKLRSDRLSWYTH